MTSKNKEKAIQEIMEIADINSSKWGRIAYYICDCKDKNGLPCKSCIDVTNLANSFEVDYLLNQKGFSKDLIKEANQIHNDKVAINDLIESTKDMN